MGLMTPEQTRNSPIPGITDVLQKCKQLARDIKSQRPSRDPLPAGIHPTLPDPAVMNQLVQSILLNRVFAYFIFHHSEQSMRAI